MRTARQPTLCASLALCLAVLIACVQAGGGVAWFSCGDESAAAGDDSCCCAAGQPGEGCCSGRESSAAWRDRLIEACGCGHRHAPGATTHSHEPIVVPNDAVRLFDPGAEAAPAPACSARAVTLRPAPEPPPPRARA